MSESKSDALDQLGEEGICLVPPLGIEPSSSVLQTGAMTTSAKAAIKMVPLAGLEPAHAGLSGQCFGEV